MVDGIAEKVCALKASAVCRSYGRQKVLHNLDLTLAKGEFAVLMGPSGSGKTTFLHLAAGLEKVDSGTISVGGFDITAMGDSAAARFRRRHIGVIFQSFNLLESATVAENIVMPVRLDHGEIDTSRLSELVSKLGLEGLECKRPAELSGGERQRVAIARAMFAGPDVVLADEPTGNLDMSSSKRICDLMRRVNKEESRTMLLVTHDPVVAACASVVHFLKNGRIADSFHPNGDASAISRRYVEIYD